MSGLASLAIGTAVWMTFTCNPVEERVPDVGPLIVSFLHGDARVRSIRSINPVGSQDRRGWRGRVTDEGYELSLRENCLVNTRTFTLRPDSSGNYDLADYFAITCGHVPMNGTDHLLCELQSTEDFDQ